MRLHLSESRAFTQLTTIFLVGGSALAITLVVATINLRISQLQILSEQSDILIEDIEPVQSLDIEHNDDTLNEPSLELESLELDNSVEYLENLPLKQDIKVSIENNEPDIEINIGGGQTKQIVEETENGVKVYVEQTSGDGNNSSRIETEVYQSSSTN